MTTVWIYVDTSKDVGDPDHLRVFATPEAADEWFKDNDPEGVAFGYEVLGRCTYGVFFKNNDYVGARMSIMIDSCEKQAFTPFRYGPLSTVR